MSRKSSISGFALVLLCTTLLSSQETQTPSPAQPPSVYNRARIRRVSPQDASSQGQQQTTQQFPSSAQQFPPEQQGESMPGQRPPMRFPHPTAPQEQQPIPQSPAPQAQIVPPNTVSQTVPQAQSDSGLALKPANPPRISYRSGELTVAADNSSMSDVMAAIQRAIGAHLEGSRPDAERVFGQFTGTPRQVLSSLLSGSHYDFILIGAIDDPGVVERIILSPHGASSSPNTAALNQPGQRQSVPTTPQDEDNEGVVTQQPAQEMQPQQQAPYQANVPSEQSQPPQPGQQQQVKTPEQLLQELQRLRQQQQQQSSNPR